jgi:hypothetical protein
MIWDLIDRNWLYFYTAAAEVAERLGLRARQETTASRDWFDEAIV